MFQACPVILDITSRLEKFLKCLRFFSHFLFNQVRIYRYQQGTCSCFSQSFEKQHLLSFDSRVPYKSALEPAPALHNFTIDDHLVVQLTTKTHSPRLVGYNFTVSPDKHFRSVKYPAKFLSSPSLILSPASLAQSLAPCEMSVHRLFDHRQQEVFTCRIMHSARLLFSSVEVINSVGSVVSTAHLIRGNVLPTKEQLKWPHKCCIVDEMAGERAILIRGSKDWGICIGKWDGFVKGVAGVAGVRGKPGEPGIKGTPGIKGQPGSLSIKFFSLFEKQEWKLAEKRGDQFSIGHLSGKINSTRSQFNVNLRTGAISILPEVQEVPEAIALGFSIAILHLLCQPLGKTNYTKPSAAASEYQRNKPRGIHNEDFLLVVAAGYYANTVPTNSYIKYEIGGGACGGCGGSGGCG